MGNLSRQIADRILEDYVTRGKAGDRLPTVQALRQKYSTSNVTVVHALSLLEHDGLIHKRRGSGSYIAPRPSPSQVCNYRTIGYVTCLLCTELAVGTYQGVEKEARMRGYSVIMSGHQQNLLIGREQIERLVNSGCRSIIMYSAVPGVNGSPGNEWLEGLGVPVVLVNPAVPGLDNTSIVFDNHQAGFDMTQHLIALGHRRIAFMKLEAKGGQIVHISNKDRRDGYIDALASAGLSHHPADIWRIPWKHWETQSHGSDLDRSIEDALTGWLKSSDRPTAVITPEDRSAMRLIHKARQLGIRIHEDLQVVGFDNLESARSFHPQFTTTNPDYHKAGELAARLAIRQSEGDQKSPMTYILPVDLLPR